MDSLQDLYQIEYVLVMNQLPDDVMKWIEVSIYSNLHGFLLAKLMLNGILDHIHGGMGNFFPTAKSYS